jgi:phosphoribosylglycinamide formyltransferase-1
MKLHGCTAHFVRGAVDSGPIIAQAAVPVLDGDTPDTLAARVLAAEHRIYPLALSLVASGKARVVDEKVTIDLPGVEADGVLVAPAWR